MTSYRVTVTDRRGGRGAETLAGPSVTDLASELSACLDSLGVDELDVTIEVLDEPAPTHDLAWAVRHARHRIARRVASDRQAEAFATYGRDHLGQELDPTRDAWLREVLAGERAYAGELALEELDGYVALASCPQSVRLRAELEEDAGIDGPAVEAQRTQELRRAAGHRRPPPATRVDTMAGRLARSPQA